MLLGAAIVIVGVTTAAPAFAAPGATGRAQPLAVSVPAEAAALKPGATGTIPIRVVNPGAQPVSVRIAGRKVAFGDNGRVVVAGVDPAWEDRVEFPDGPVTIAADGYRDVGLTVHMPARISPDLYFLGFLVTPVQRGDVEPHLRQSDRLVPDRRRSRSTRTSAHRRARDARVRVRRRACTERCTSTTSARPPPCSGARTTRPRRPARRTRSNTASTTRCSRSAARDRSPLSTKSSFLVSRVTIARAHLLPGQGRGHDHADRPHQARGDRRTRRARAARGGPARGRHVVRRCGAGSGGSRGPPPSRPSSPRRGTAPRRTLVGASNTSAARIDQALAQVRAKSPEPAAPSG